MLKLKKFIFNTFQENTYLLWNETTNDAVIIDPGVLTGTEENQLAEVIRSEKLNIKYLLNTHCHLDHIFGNAFVKKNYRCEFIAPEKDTPLLKELTEHAEMFGIKAKPSPEPDKYLREDLVLLLGDIKIKSVFTPGHTPGEFCFYFESENICISGDVLFKEGIGRTDLWGGNYQTLITSIKEKLFTLPDDVIVYPGHGEKTTIGYEKLHNPFLT